MPGYCTGTAQHCKAWPKYRTVTNKEKTAKPLKQKSDLTTTASDRCDFRYTPWITAQHCKAWPRGFIKLPALPIYSTVINKEKTAEPLKQIPDLTTTANGCFDSRYTTWIAEHHCKAWPNYSHNKEKLPNL